ncbi:hypothetical protein A5740_01025 [Mycobacterium sp. GA-1841]|uniref:hypothetical protein n=1 Tax=Mycobacterium sp. GA-1841 TaxID=1834154 RepID=UPI00096F8FA1|nr:hypothetical protein [Mycobacterium sp. GA-1841]OMC34372.1 hypothetical protein A5740_01025 [Mycobacterium sp. GA-1841]
MKLARPDVFHPRIVLAGCPALPEGDGDDAGLIAALRHRGLHARWLPWDDPATLEADVVILRATWDYTERLDEFLAWTRSVRHLINPLRIVEWNTDKRYLGDLQRLGVPVVATEYFAVDDPVRIRDGETALVFLAGEQSHAFTKAPILPPPGQPPEFEETGTYAHEALSPAEPDDEVWEVGRRTLKAVMRSFDLEPADLVYARVDVIGGPADPRLLELELVEPSLGFRQLGQREREHAERQFAVGVEGALERLGLGPLSHRAF